MRENLKDISLIVIKKGGLLISKVFQGQLVIPEFWSFTSGIEKIYQKCGVPTYVKVANKITRIHTDASPKFGKPADYIPQLARANASKWGVSLCTIYGQRFSVGDVADTFTLQSTRWEDCRELSLLSLSQQTFHIRPLPGPVGSRGCSEIYWQGA